MLKRILCVLAGGLALVAGGVAQASDYPSKPIRLVVGFPPGGGTDVAARIVAQRLAGVLGQQVVVENKPGASGLIASAFVADAPADGYTLLLANMQTTVASPYVLPISYDPIKAFTAVRYIGAVPNVLVVNPDKNGDLKSVSDLIERLKANPGKYTYASSGQGSPQHLTAARFSQITGTQMEHIPYKGSGQAVADLLGGQVDMNFDTLPSVIGQIQAGKLRALAVTSEKRAPALPNVPTLAEAGVAGMDVVQWYAVLAPAGIPERALKRLDEAIGQTLADPAVSNKLADQGMAVGGGPDNPQAFQAFIEQEYGKYGRIVADLGLKKQ